MASVLHCRTEWSMSVHLSMAISRMKASSDVLSLLRAIVLMACKCHDRSNTVDTTRFQMLLVSVS
jgi:hypothetical protein